ncbi:hypothetical protein [Olivibacter sitiensis]|uniref:hypothetical protein n=1 Tax=Olivibacter sitiensis TaxID=376470 RepID=UPI0012FB6ED9|nr:hypothetical protein [Olivibacter sitiensis]
MRRREPIRSKIKVYLVCFAISTLLFYYFQRSGRAGSEGRSVGKDFQEKGGQRDSIYEEVSDRSVVMRY